MPRTIKLKTSVPWEEIRVTDADWLKADVTTMVRMLHNLNLIRAFEETVLELAGENLVHGPAHSSIGQEGAAVGAMAAVRTGDQINGTHRAHHQFLAKALNHATPDTFDPLAGTLGEGMQAVVQRTLAEIMGLEQGYCGGRGGSMHLRSRESGVIGTNAIVGGGVPIATGVAWSRKRLGRGDVVISFFGDGAIHQGAVAESFNLASLYNLPILYFIENNQYAVSTTVAEATRETRLAARGQAYGIPAFTTDGMDPLAVKITTEKALSILRAGKGPVIVEADCYRFFHQNGPLPGSAFGYRSKDEEQKWRERDPPDYMASRMIEVGHLNKSQTEKLRSEARAAVERAANNLLEPDGNRRRIKPELWPSRSAVDHGVRGDMSEFDGVRYEEKEDHSGDVVERKFIDLVSSVMGRRMEVDERIFVIGEDIHKLRGGTNGATKGLIERFPDRIIGTPITEGGFAGLAGGVAADGHFRPVVEFMYADFVYVAADQVLNQIAKMRHMFGGDLPVPLVLRAKVAAKSGYGSQHSMDPSGLFTLFPGWRIVAPSTPYDYVGLMNSALLCEDPVLVVEHIDLYQSTGPAPLEDLDYFIPLGKAKVVRYGTDFTVLTSLAMVWPCVELAEQAGVGAEVIDLRTLDRASLDWETIGASVRKTNNVLIVEQGTQGTSFGGAIADELHRRFFDYLDQPVKRVVGGEAAPTISKVLDLAANASDDDILAGYEDILSDSGRLSRDAAE